MTQLPAEALLFDMDGTLVDSTALVESTWGAFAERHSLDVAEILDFAHGRTTRATVQHFLADPALAAAETDQIVAYEEVTTAGVTAVPGARELIKSLRGRRWAVVTSATRELARNRMAAVDIPIPDVLISAEDVAVGKPDPQGYLVAAAALGVSVESTVIFEDSSAGTRAGIASGGTTVVIGALSEFDATLHRFPDFRGFSVTDSGTPGPMLLNASQPANSLVTELP